MNITKAQYARIEKYFPVQRGNVKIDNYTFINVILYSIATLSPIIVIYRQVLPNRRKISIFEGRNMENCVTALFLKNHQNADFW